MTTDKLQLHQTCAFKILCLMLCDCVEESLLVLRTLGIQTSTTSSTYLSTSTTRFIPTSQVQDIFIHEAFKGFEVRYYLAAVVEGEAEVVVVFPVSPFYTEPRSYSGNLIFLCPANTSSELTAEEGHC